MSVFLTDYFTAADGTAVTAHTPDSGGSWANVIGGPCLIYNNAALATTGSPTYGYHVHSAAASSGVEEVLANWTLVPSAKTCGVLIRASADGSNFYMVYWTAGSSNTIQVWSRKGGTLAAEGTAQSFTPTGDHTMRVTCETVGATVEIKCYMDGAGTPTAAWTDSNANRITTPGRAGFVINGATASSGYALTSITAQDSSSSAATGTSLTGPTSGTVGIASSNFTVGVTPTGGTITGTLRVTPNDSSGGGTFTPTYLDLTTASPSGTFTYTAGSAGTKTIATTNDGGLTNPSSISFSATSSDAITISTPVTRRIHQRSGTTGTIAVSGTYAGSPTTIEARLVQDGTSTPVTGFDWETKVASPSGGVYSFSFTSVPQGGWYNVQVRFSNATSVNATGGRVGVGALFAVCGQSNGWYWFRSRTTAITPNDLTCVYGNVGTWALPDNSAMAGAISCANAIASALSIPVGMLDYSASGGSIANWVPVSGTTNRNFTNAAAALDGKLEGVIWVQGEGDADASRTQAQYYGDLGTLFADWRSQFSQASLPIVLVTIGQATSGLYTDAESQAILNAQIQKCGDTAIYRVDRKDLPLLDTVHHTAAGFETLGARCARAALCASGAVANYRGPQIAEARQRSATIVDVYLTHVSGTDFTPTSGITGFRVLDGGSPIAVSSAVRLSATRIRLTMGASLAGLPSIQYLYGNSPTVTGVVLDNSPLALPLEVNDGVTATLAVATATVTLVDEAGAAEASLASLNWAWFDQVTPDLFSAPTDKGTGEVTDGSGVLTVDLPNTTLASTQVGWLIVTNSDGTTTQSPAHRAFSGPVAVD